MAWPATGEWITACVGAAQVGTAVLIVRPTSGREKATKQYARDTSALLAETVQQRNLMERQINERAIAAIRKAAIECFDDGQTSLNLRGTLSVFEASLMEHAPGLPHDPFDQLKKAVHVLHELAFGDAAKRISGTFGLRDLIKHVSLAAQNTIDAYWRSPGRPLDPIDLPAPTDDLGAWISEKERRDSR